MSNVVFNNLAEALDCMHNEGWMPIRMESTQDQPPVMVFRRWVNLAGDPFPQDVRFRFQVNDYSEMLGEEKMTATVREWDWSE